jgi:hypothetical protein
MAQSDGEIKMNLPRGQTINRSISRDGKSREIYNEKKLRQEALKEDELLSSRREFFSAVIPASGKVLTSILRSVGTTLSSVVEESKNLRKKTTKT